MKKATVVFAACLMSSLVGWSKAPEIPRDTSFTAYSTNKKIRRQSLPCLNCQPASGSIAMWFIRPSRKLLTAAVISMWIFSVRMMKRFIRLC